MSCSPFRYLLWVLLPVGAGVLLSQHLATRETESITQASTSRIGNLAAHLFSEEMGVRAGELAQEAPILTNPDPSSPLIQAAQRADTVVALGTSSGELTLSLALLEGSGDSLRIRATTAPFHPTTLGLVRSRTGFGIALYLRGIRAISAPQDFGPERIQEPGTPPPSPSPGALQPGSAFFPLASSGKVASPAQLLVGPSRTLELGTKPWHGVLVILLAWGLGLLAWFILPPKGMEERGPNFRLLTLTGLPLIVLWASLLWTGNRVEAGAEELQREDMVRVLALMKGGVIPLSPEEITGSTGFQLLRSEEGEIVESTLSPGPMADRLMALPIPAPTFPSLGVLEEEGQEVVYANLWEGPGRSLSLVAPTPRGSLLRLRLVLAALGGGASLLSLGFLLGVARGRDG